MAGKQQASYTTGSVQPAYGTILKGRVQGLSGQSRRGISCPGLSAAVGPQPSQPRRLAAGWYIDRYAARNRHLLSG